MRKEHKHQFRKLYSAAIAVVVLVALAYLSRGWIRSTGETAAISLTFGRNVAQTLDSQLKALNNPFQALGISSTQRSDECRLSYAKNFHSEITCTSTINGFAKLSASQQASLAAGSAALEKNFKTEGWSGGNTSITTLGQNISKSIDYTPDAAYQKSIGRISCLADFNTAFSKPRPAAINGSINCSRTYYIWGRAACPGGRAAYYDRTGQNLLWTECQR